ncbi:MAG: hypothetical protein ACTSV2_06570 [Candidatus Thorarchaeota archaeon]
MVNVIDDELGTALRIFENPKFMITCNNEGEPNIVPVMSWTVYDGDTLIYGDFMTYKTRQNLIDGHSKMGLFVLNMDLESWMIQADFESYHTNDEIYEFMAMTPLFRYNQYTNARAAGVAQALSASSKFSISKINVLTEFLKVKRAAKKVPTEDSDEGNLPLNVYIRFSRMAAIKIVSFYNEDGYPSAFPAFGMVPVSSNRLVMRRTEEIRRGMKLNDGQRVAISLVTLEPAAFQVKGTFREIDNNLGYIILDRVYTCSLPRPGLRVDVPLL